MKCSEEKVENNFELYLTCNLTPFLDTTGLEEQEREKRRQVMEKFQKAPFEEIAAHCESKVK